MAKMLALFAITTAVTLNLAVPISGQLEKENYVVSKETIPVTKGLTVSGKMNNPNTNSTHRNDSAKPKTGRVHVYGIRGNKNNISTNLSKPTEVQSSISRNTRGRNKERNKDLMRKLQINLTELFRPRQAKPTFNCWKACGKKGGYCPNACGKNGFCCKKGVDGECPSELLSVASAVNHTCVVVGTDSSLGEEAGLSFSQPNHCTKLLQPLNGARPKLSMILSNLSLRLLEDFTHGLVVGDNTLRRITKRSCGGDKTVSIKTVTDAEHRLANWLQIPRLQELDLTFNWHTINDTDNPLKVELIGRDLIRGVETPKTSMRKIPGNDYSYWDLDFDWEPTALNFLQSLELQLDSLYPRKNNLPTLVQAIHDLSYPEGRISFIPADAENVDRNVFAMLFQSTREDLSNTLAKTSIFCKRDFITKNCALLERVTRTSPITRLVPGMDIANMATALELFPNKRFPDRIFFQSAKKEIVDVSEIPWYEEVIKYITINDNRENMEMNNGGNIIPDACFRYRYEGMHDSYDVRVNMCPTENSYRFSFPDLVPLSPKATVSLVYGTEVQEESSVFSWLRETSNHQISIDFVEVSPSSYVSGAYKLLICMKPQITSTSNSGFKLVPRFPFSQIKDSTIDIEIDGNIFKIKGNGEEKILGHKATFNVRTEGDVTKVTYTLSTTSNRLLMNGMKEENGYMGNNEADLNGYITPFEALQNITLNNVVLDTDIVYGGEFKFISDAKIGDLTDVKFQLALWLLETKSCVYKENGGQIAPFLKTIQGKTFFGQSWLGYEKIGIIMSPTSARSNHICHSTDSSWAENVDRITSNSELDISSGDSTTVAMIGNDYVIRFDFRIFSLSGNGSGNIPLLRMSLNGSYIDLVRAQVHSDTNEVTICREVNQNCQQLSDLPNNNWHSVRMTQGYFNSSHVNYTIYLNGKQEYQIQLPSDSLQSFENIKIKYGDPDHRSSNGRADIRNLFISEYPKKVGVRISNLKFDCEIEGTGENGTEVVDRKKGCQFMQRVFATDGKVTTELDGWMSSTNMFLSGATTQQIVLGDSVRLGDGNNPIIVKLIVRPSSRDESSLDFLRFVSCLKLYGAPGKCYPAVLIVSGDVIRLFIKRMDRIDIPNIPIHSSPSFEVWIKPRGRIPIVHDQAMDIVEMRAIVYLSMNMAKEDPFIISGQSRMRQYIDPWTPTESKFYACTDKSRNLRTSYLLSNIGVEGRVRGFLDTSTIEHFCLVYNNGDTAWEVPSIGKTFDAGLTFIGKLRTNFGNGGKQLYLPFKASYTPDNTMHFCTRLPVLKWGVKLAPTAEEVDEENLAAVPLATVEDEKTGQLIITEKYMCDLTDEYNVEFDESSSIIFHGKDAGGCVTECVKLCHDDPTLCGVIMRGEGDNGECLCAKNMEYSTETSPSEYKTCILQDIGQHALQMHYGKGKTKEAFGPQMCYRVPEHGSEEHFSAYMRGYLKTFLFEMDDAMLEITAPNSDRLTGYTLSNIEWVQDNVLLLNGLYARVELRATGRSRLPVDPSKIDFTIKITINNFRQHSEQIVEAGSKLADRDIRIFRTHQVIFQTQIHLFREWHDRENRVLQAFKSSTQSVRRSFNQDSINRARAMNSYTRLCARECGHVKIPGWTVDESCHSNKDGQSMSCLKYKRDANYASNVGCIANCEAERVKSFIDAKRLHARAVISGSNLDLKEQCERKGENYVNKLNEILSSLLSSAMLGRLTKKGIEQFKNENLPSWPGLIDNLVAETKIRRIEDPRCLHYTIQFKGNKFRPTKICLDSFFEDLVRFLYSKEINEREMKLKSQNYEFEFARNKKILMKDHGSIDYRALHQLQQDFVECKSDHTKKAEKVGKRVRSLQKLKDGDFTKFQVNTMESFNKISPWEVAKKIDITHEMQKLKKTLVPAQMQNRTISKDEEACSVARRASIEYNDIASYILKWSEVQNGAKRTLKNLKDMLKIEDSYEMVNSPFFDKNYTAAEKSEIKFWKTRATDGMKKWIDIEEERMKQYNTESLPVIRKQLEFTYAANNNKNISDFLLQRSVDGTNAFKRANIQTQSPYTFSYLYQDLANILNSGKNLDEISERIADISKHTDVLSKRTISCAS